jgi:hypothetical protein
MDWIIKMHSLLVGLTQKLNGTPHEHDEKKSFQKPGDINENPARYHCNRKRKKYQSKSREISKKIKIQWKQLSRVDWIMTMNPNKIVTIVPTRN